MARTINDRDLGPVIDAAQRWISECLIADQSVFSGQAIWTTELVAEVRQAFIEHPDEGDASFITKLKGQVEAASPTAQRLMAEMMWALLLFPSNIKPATKRDQIRDVWAMSGELLPVDSAALSDQILEGIGSGGTGYNNHRWREMAFLITLVGDLKQREPAERESLLTDYDKFVDWIASIPEKGKRQFKHMLRFFAFPDRVERMCVNRERRRVLDAFGVAKAKESRKWDDRKLDDALLQLRQTLQEKYPNETLDFYEPPLRDHWIKEKDKGNGKAPEDVGQQRRFWWVNQGKTYELAKTGGFIWAPKKDRSNVTPFDWENVTRVSPGDIVFNYAEKFIRAISLVSSKSYDSDRGALPSDWDKAGWRADLAYHELATPVSIKQVGPKLRDLDLHHGPINRDANVNQGYLYELSAKAAQLVLDEIGEGNLPPAIAAALTSAVEPVAGSPLASILRRYYDEQIIFTSSEHKRRYLIDSMDKDGVFVARLDGEKPERVTFAHAQKLTQRVHAAGEVEFSSLDNTVAFRNTVLQSEELALSADQKTIKFLPDSTSRLQNFLQLLDNLRTVQPLYKPGMLLCVVEGIESGDLSENRIPFDWIAPRFIAKLKSLGTDITEREAAQPFYHLSGDLIWLHAVQDRANLMQDGGEGPKAAREKIKYALLKDTYWSLLQDPISRTTVRRHLEAIIMPKLSPAELLLAAQAAVKATGFVHTPDLLRRFISSVATKPFVILTGNSGTGKTKLAQLLAQWLSGSDGQTQTSYAVVPVGADWTDNRNVVGFVNHLRKNDQQKPIYQSTPVLDLILRARDDAFHPYFLILDEMNLSHVERYFSDFLSAMESKKPIPLHNEKQELMTASGATVPSGIEFPENLFVIGTVNVDETTYMFSPKVLDRANVLEFRITPDQADGFLKSTSNHVAPLTPNPGAPMAFMGLSLQARGLTEPELPSLQQAALDECQKSLNDLFGLLHKARLEFAFRTLAEVMRYLRVDFALSGKPSDWQWQGCLDAQLLQKVLPKLHGSRRRLEAILVALATYCEASNLSVAEEKLKRDTDLTGYPEKAAPSEIQFSKSHAKLLEMIEAVRRDQFVSFIQ